MSCINPWHRFLWKNQQDESMSTFFFFTEPQKSTPQSRSETLFMASALISWPATLATLPVYFSDRLIDGCRHNISVAVLVRWWDLEDWGWGCLDELFNQWQIRVLTVNSDLWKRLFGLAATCGPVSAPNISINHPVAGDENILEWNRINNVEENHLSEVF